MPGVSDDRRPPPGTSPAGGSSRSAASRSRSATTGSSARRRSRSAPPARARTRSPSRSRCGRPGHEAELAVGFLRTEGLLDGQEVLGTAGGDPGSLSQPDDTIVVRLSQPFDDSKVAERHFVATASCGICGKASIDEVALRCRPAAGRPGRARARSSSPCRTCCAPPSARSTRPAGCTRPACSRPAGELIAIREDVGRHNALDKLVGSQVLAGAMPLHDRILMVSGRVSFEIVQKAAVAGIPIVCAVSAPSDLAIETAERLGVTLVGFLRGDGFNVYAHDARIDLRDLSGLG